MGKYFGTDGFRGEANVDLTADHAYKIGKYLGYLVASQTEDGRGRIVIGKDTRHSGDMFEMALAAGITSMGTDACLLGVVTTPGVAFITRQEDFAFGVMISASHNPFNDNGIKVLNAHGEKLGDDVIADIEAYMDGDPAAVAFVKGDAIGRVVDYQEACDTYAEHLMALANQRLDGMKIGLDCANGSAWDLAPHIYGALGAEVSAISVDPNGCNINVNCGSTHMDALCAYVRENGLDLGFAYDGDADRCLAVDGEGNVVNGDQIIYMCACALKDEGRLGTNTAVTTIMSNLGLYKALDAAGIAYEKTSVGDRYVYENMVEYGHAIGGEQSGHIIFKEFATTGDGILTSLMVMNAIKATGKTIAELVAPMTIYPQVLENVRVTDKQAVLQDPDVKAAVAAVDEALCGNGRAVVRPSGTEPLVRLMVEAADEQTCREHIAKVAAVIAAKGFVAE